jgi:hypothetical protein
VRNAYRLFVGKYVGKRPVGYLGVGERIILNRILKQKMGEDWSHVDGTKGSLACCYRHGSEMLRAC